MIIKRNVTKEIKTIARELVGRVKAGKVIVPKKRKLLANLPWTEQDEHE